MKFKDIKPREVFLSAGQSLYKDVEGKVREVLTDALVKKLWNPEEEFELAFKPRRLIEPVKRKKCKVCGKSDAIVNGVCHHTHAI